MNKYCRIFLYFDKNLSDSAIDSIIEKIGDIKGIKGMSISPYYNPNQKFPPLPLPLDCCEEVSNKLERYE